MNIARTGYINVRVDPKVKASATKLLHQVGMTTSDAINLFLHQVVLHKGLPFELKVPNEETAKAIREMRNPKFTSKKYETVDELFIEVLGKDWKNKLK